MVGVTMEREVRGTTGCQSRRAGLETAFPSTFKDTALVVLCYVVLSYGRLQVWHAPAMTVSSCCMRAAFTGSHLELKAGRVTLPHVSV